MKLTKTLLMTVLPSALMMASWARGEAAFKNLVSFTFTNGPDYGAFGVGSRSGAMVQGNDGNLYGTTPTGGVVSNVPGYFGTIFKMAPDGTFTSLYLFGTVFVPEGGNDNGHWPQGNLIQGADGNLYGTTQYGGPPNSGTVFQITTNGDLTTFYNFGNNAGYDPQLGWTNYDGDAPIGGLVQGSDGNFYGTTPSYGVYGNGTVFRLTPDGLLTTLHAFTALDQNNFYENADGANPMGELIEGKDGNFYGTTTHGGTNAYGSGTIFQITTGGAFTTLHSFSSGNGGCFGGLVQGNDGNLYGTTSGGFGGTIFQITTNGAFTTLHTFNGPDGATPYAALIQGSDGNFYGTTAGGGPNGESGTAFRITSNGAFTTLHAFNGSDGSSPNAALVQAADGSFYGTTSRGAAGYGTIFHIVIPPVFQTITQTNGGMALTWSVMPGQKSQLQYNTDLSGTNWLNLGSSATASNITASAFDSTTRPQCFYRIMLMP
jgi:uncharacterized repeat protein (TIGR03803 family)